MLLANNLYQSPFSPSTVKLSIKNLLPWSEIELPLGDRDHHFPPHDLALQMSVCVILPGSIVVILRCVRMRSQFFEPNIIIVKQSVLGVVDKNRGRDVRCLFAT